MPLWVWPTVPPSPGIQAPPSGGAAAAQKLVIPGQIDIRRGIPYAVFGPVRQFHLREGAISYGETVLEADEIILYPDGTDTLPPGSGIAKGHVKLTDPVGELSADNATFNWITRTGTANFATARFEGVEVSAATARVQPGIWHVDGISAGMAGGKPVVSGLAAHAVVRPGKGMTFYDVRAKLFGRKTFGVHHLEYQQEGHIGGDHYPVPTFSGDRGLGVRYRPLYLIDDRTAVGASFVANQAALPSYGATLSRSFLPNGEAHGLVVPRYDLDMRFDFGYFDNVGVSDPTDEHQRIGQQRDNISADTQFNVQAYDRKGNEVFDKPLEATFERALPLPYGFTFMTDHTLQQIRSLGGSDHDRYLEASTLSFPVFRISPTVTARLRVDQSAFLGGDVTFSWLHSQIGLIYRPNDNLRLGAAYIAGKQFGTPLYQVDELYSVNGAAFRADYRLGPHSISLLAKYDTDRGAWFDREVRFGQVMGPVEGFIRFRTFPSQLIFGAELRVDSLFNQLLSRNPSRPAPPAKLAD